MNRRRFLNATLLGAGAGSSDFTKLLAASNPSAARHLPATIGGATRTVERNNLQGAWMKVKAIALQSERPDSVLTLRWEGVEAAASGVDPQLRLGLVSNLSTFQRLEFSLPGGAVIGELDISLGCPFELLNFHIPLPHLPAVLQSGVEVRARGKGPAIEVFAPGGSGAPELVPHLLLPGTLTARQEFLNRMASRASLTGYGWRGGCVLDGLAALAATQPDGARYQAALDDQLSLFFPKRQPITTTQGSVEGTLCIAQLVRKNPQHRAIAATLDFWQSKQASSASGTINDGTQTAAEGNYTVAWPLAVLARELQRPELAAQAILELRHRRNVLVDSTGAIWLRHRANAKPPLSYCLWSRGVAWYLIGLARTLDVLPEPPEDLVAELKRASAYLLPLQDQRGLWHIFAAEPDTAPESSGTAGIGAALAIGARRGWLGEKEKAAAQRALEGLETRLTPDGFLQGVAPSNKPQGGEPFQRSTKGYIMQIGMGMMAQLIAELEPR